MGPEPVVSLEVRDSRRVPGLNVIWDRPCAVLDLALDDSVAESFLERWQAAAREAQAALEWESACAFRRFPGGMSLALAAPLDALYTATEVNEWAAAAAAASLRAAPAPAPSLEQALPLLRRSLGRERRRKKGLVRLAAAAEAHGAGLFPDDDCTSVGMGAGSLSFATGALPLASSIDWSRVHDVPTALVTGTNGKSTTVRLLAAMSQAAGRTCGISTTDWVRVGETILQRGDYSGPSGARLVLRDQRVDLAVLECARGGLSRRGLAVRKVRAALITNVARDHLGEWGVNDLEALADVKFVLARAVEPGGALVLNADDPVTLGRASRYDDDPRVAWFSRTASNEVVARALARGRGAAWQAEGALWCCMGGERARVIGLDEAAFLFGGAAKHNVSNALAALCVARALELPWSAIRDGIAGFASDPSGNPGRLNRFEFGGVQVLCDFAHNPHGMVPLLDLIRALPARRRLVILGQAGDRDDHSIRELARLSAQAQVDRIVLKEMPEHLRGRASGVVVAMLAQELARAGYPAAQVELAVDETDAVRRALVWSRPGDLLLLLLHAQRQAVLDWLAQLSREGWEPGRGEPTPPARA